MQNDEPEVTAEVPNPPKESPQMVLEELGKEIEHKYSLLEENDPELRLIIDRLRQLKNNPTTWIGECLEKVQTLDKTASYLPNLIAVRASNTQTLKPAIFQLYSAIIVHIAQFVWMECGVLVDQIESPKSQEEFHLDWFQSDNLKRLIDPGLQTPSRLQELLETIRRCAIASRNRDSELVRLAIEDLNSKRVGMGFPAWVNAPAESVPITPHHQKQDESDVTFGNNQNDAPQPEFETKLSKTLKPEIIEVTDEPIPAQPVLPEVDSEQSIANQSTPRNIRERVRSFGLPITLENKKSNEQNQVGAVAELSLEDANSQELPDKSNPSIYPQTALDQAQVFQVDSGLELMQDQMSRSSGWNGILLDRLETSEPHPQKAVDCPAETESALESPKMKDGGHFRLGEPYQTGQGLETSQVQAQQGVEHSQRTISHAESVPVEGSVRPIPAHGQLQNPLFGYSRRGSAPQNGMSQDLRNVCWEKIIEFENSLFGAIDGYFVQKIKETLKFAVLLEIAQIQMRASALIEKETQVLQSWTAPDKCMQILSIILVAARELVHYSKTTNWNAPLWFAVKWITIMWFMYDFVGWTVPPVSRDTLDAMIGYVIRQDNLFIAIIIRQVLLMFADESLKLSLFPENYLVSTNFKLWTQTFLRSLIFTVIMISSPKDLSESNWTLFLLNSIFIEIIANLDALSQDILARNRKLSLNVLETCAQLDIDGINSQIIPQMLRNERDYKLVTFVNASLVMALSVISMVTRGSVGYLLIFGLYLIFYYAGCWLEMRQKRFGVLELGFHKRYSKQTIYWMILYGAFRLNTLLIVTSHAFFQESRYDLSWLISIITLMLVMMYIRDDAISIIKNLSGNRKINTRFRDVIVDPNNLPDCTICQSRIGRPVQTQCGHIYHWHCIVLWYVYHKQQCPNCRANLD